VVDADTTSRRVAAARSIRHWVDDLQRAVRAVDVGDRQVEHVLVGRARAVVVREVIVQHQCAVLQIIVV
jgi:hypothetical protein